MARWFDRLTQRRGKRATLIGNISGGSLYKVSDVRNLGGFSDIKNVVETMRALANDSQISTALSYYATDATTPNSSGQIIWATPVDPDKIEAADIVNEKFKQWKINDFARDHILELATIGNLYVPTTRMYGERTAKNGMYGLDGNFIADDDYEIIPSYALNPSKVLHLWYRGEDQGFVYQDEDDDTVVIKYPSESIIHFSLGGLLGAYKVEGRTLDGEDLTYDAQFGTPLMNNAVQPTQTLGLLEDAFVLSSLSRMVRFINVDCGADEEEASAILQQLKSMVEQCLSLNTGAGDMQSYVNPQSPNNLIYLPKVNGQDAISITDLNMAEVTDADNKLLDYYQNKKLSVLGVPKEAMNFSSAEGLGGAGQVMSQRSALYANCLGRLETAYMAGWKTALNNYFVQHGLSGFVDQFDLHMNPILTQLSTINFERRDSAVSQASGLVDLMKNLNVSDSKQVASMLTEVLSEALPKTGSDCSEWDINMEEGGEPDAF